VITRIPSPGDQLFFEFMNSEVAAEMYVDELVAGDGEPIAESGVRSHVRGDEPDEPAVDNPKIWRQ